MIEGLKPYPCYTSSSLPWLPRPPEHWAIKRAKSVVRCVDERSLTGTEELLTVSSAHGVVPRRSATVTTFKAKSYVGYKLCWPGDLVINSLWAWAGGLGTSAHHGIVSSAYGVYRVRDGVPLHPRFLHELVRSSPFSWELQNRSKGIWISRLQLTDGSFLDAPLPLPPPDEQAAIVRFLDHVNRRIERYIRGKRKLIALLNEQKQAIIHRAVTRGLDPNAPMKDSGVPWLGHIPAHWEVRRAKQLCSTIVDCKNRTPEFVPNGEFTVVRTTNIREGRFRIEGSYRTDRRNFDVWTERGGPRVGDVFFTREAPAGEAALVPPLPGLCMGQRMMYLRPNPSVLDARFLLHNIYGPCVRTYIDNACNGSTVGHLRLGQVGSLPIAWCPLEEQVRLVEHVEKASVPLNVGVARAEREIALMREYRTRLVSDVVTGQLDVREAARNLPDLESEAAARDAPDADEESTPEDDLEGDEAA